MGGLWNYLRREVESIREMHPLVSDVQDLGSFVLRFFFYLEYYLRSGDFVLRFSTWNKHATQHLLPMYGCQLVFEVYLEAVIKLLYLNYASFCEVGLLKKAFDGTRHKSVPYLFICYG